MAQLEEQSVTTLNQVTDNDVIIPWTEEHIDLDIAKAMARMRGLKFIAIDSNGEIWGYSSEPRLDEEYIWQSEEAVNLETMAFICRSPKPEDAEEELYEL